MTTGESTLREAAERAKLDVDGPVFEEAAAIPRAQMWSEFHSDVFLTSLYRPPSYAPRVTDLIVDVLRDESHEFRDLWRRIPVHDLEEIVVFNLLLDEILWQPPALTGARRFSITMIEGAVAGWAGIIGARTGRDPDRTPTILKAASRMKAWRLEPPSQSDEQLERRAAQIRDGLALPLISAHFVDRVTRSLVAHSTPPMSDTLRRILREMSRGNMEILTLLARAGDDMIAKSIDGKGSRRFLAMLVSHAAYRGLLVGYQNGTPKIEAKERTK